MIKTKQLRSFTNSAAARAAGFSTIEWLRAFTFSEHAARIDASHAMPKWWKVEE